MSAPISIRPSKDLRNNYAQISKLAKEHPVAITVNGREDIVIISHDEYNKQQEEMALLRQQLSFYAHMIQSISEANAGMVESFDDVFAKVEKIVKQ